MDSWQKSATNVCKYHIAHFFLANSIEARDFNNKGSRIKIAVKAHSLEHKGLRC